MSSWGDEGRSLEELRAERIAKREANRIYKRRSREREADRERSAMLARLAGQMINRKRGT